MTSATEHRKLAAIMFTDMVGYSALSQRHEGLALELLEEHRHLVRGILPQHGGREVKTTGDGFLIEFPSALAAVQCAIDVQAALHTRNLSQQEERQVRIRIGIHVGDVVVRDGDVHGDGVNLAARIEPLAGPGGIVVSRAVQEQVANKLEAQLASLGRAELKNIEGGLEVYRVVLPWQRGRVARTTSARSRLLRRAAPWTVASLFGMLLGVVFVATQRRSPNTHSINWHGQRLGGPSIALRPVVSPDGKEVAFTPLDQGMTQVGVMIVESGDWRLLTTNRTRGNVGYLCWSRDGTELLYDRLIGEPIGVFRISKYGGEERLIVGNVQAPQELPDGSLLVARRRNDRLFQLHRYQFDGQRLEPRNAVLGDPDFGMPYRLLPGGQEVVFLGWPADSSSQVKSLWVLNLPSGRCELLDPTPPPTVIEWASPPHVPDPTDGSLVSVQTVGDAYRLVRRPRQAYFTPQTLLSLTLAPVDLDVSTDGSLYLDQVERPVEILRCGSSNQVERIPLSASYQNPQVLPLPGDRLLLSTRVAGHHRLVVLARGQEAAPFLISKEESREPLALLGRDRVLCRTGGGSNWVVSIVSIADGRVLGHVESIPADASLLALAAAPDGKTVYYVAKGAVWSVPVAGGSAKKLREGDGVAPDPRGDSLLILIKHPEGARLVRVPLTGGPEEIVPTQLRVAPLPLSPNAVSPDGRIALMVAPTDSWYWPAAILDPRTGAMEPVCDVNADMRAPGWDDQGRVVVAAQFLRSSLWRFRPEK